MIFDTNANENFVKRLINYNSSIAYRLYESIRKLTNSSDQASQIEYNFLKAFRDVDPNTLKNRVYGVFSPQAREADLKYVLNMQRAMAVSKNSFDSNGVLSIEIILKTTLI